MELDLSNLVDLSLGKPHYLACENFNLLHTLLHIILKKMNLSNTRVMLTDDLADKAQELMKMMPKEPSICYKEVILLNDCIMKESIIKFLNSSQSKTMVQE